MNFFSPLMIMMLTFLKYNCFKLQHNWKVSFSVAFGDFFGNYRVFQHFLSLIPKMSLKSSLNIFFYFCCFSNSRTIERLVMVWLFGTNELCCFCTHPKRHWKYLWKCIYFRIQFSELIEIVSNLTYLSTLKKVGQCECILLGLQLSI